MPSTTHQEIVLYGVKGAHRRRRSAARTWRPTILARRRRSRQVRTPTNANWPIDAHGPERDGARFSGSSPRHHDGTRRLRRPADARRRTIPANAHESSDGDAAASRTTREPTYQYPGRPPSVTITPAGRRAHVSAPTVTLDQFAQPGADAVDAAGDGCLNTAAKINGVSSQPRPTRAAVRCSVTRHLEPRRDRAEGHLHASRGSGGARRQQRVHHADAVLQPERPLSGLQRRVRAASRIDGESTGQARPDDVRAAFWGTVYTPVVGARHRPYDLQVAGVQPGRRRPDAACSATTPVERARPDHHDAV